MPEKISLAAPGAGLPPVELLLSRWGFRALRSMLTRDRIHEWLNRETQQVLGSAQALSEDQLKRQVLVPRLMGLEDSSRNWSVAMVLQHLVIVDTGIRELLAALSGGQTFDREVRIADVKPHPEAGQEQIGQLESAVMAYRDQVTAINNLHTAYRHAHPWFGSLDGHGWHTLAALHTMIHRRQLGIIIQVLKKSA